MRRLIFWILLIPAVAAFGTFALNNRALVALDLWPFGVLVELPVYLALALALGVGAVLGGVASWVSSARTRRKAKSSNYEGEVAKRELAQANNNTERLESELAALRSQARQPRPRHVHQGGEAPLGAEKNATILPPH